MHEKKEMDLFLQYGVDNAQNACCHQVCVVRLKMPLAARKNESA